MMEQYIPKSALVAEIEKRIKEREEEEKKGWAYSRVKIVECEHILSFIDTIEVKEVDLDSYYHKFLEKEWFNNPHVRTVSEMMAFTAKYFFELGLKTQKGEEV